MKHRVSATRALSRKAGAAALVLTPDVTGCAFDQP
jgi:hypothetical protein